MPTLPPTPCKQSGCPALTTTVRCPAHRRPPILLRMEHDEHRGSSTQRGYGYAWQQRRAAYIKAHPCCAWCGKPTTDVDHVIPRSRGGSDSDSNLQPLCGRCHKQKTARERHA